MRRARPIPGLALEDQPEEIIARCLAVGEARGEQDDTGRLEAVAMLGVLWVPRIRQRRPRWQALTLKAIMLQRWQFSCFNLNDPNREKLLTAWRDEPEAWERADTVADLLEEGFASDPTQGATHYCTLALWDTEPAPDKPVQWYHRSEIQTGRTHPTVRWGQHQFATAP